MDFVYGYIFIFSMYRCVLLSIYINKRKSDHCIRNICKPSGISSCQQNKRNSHSIGEYFFCRSSYIFIATAVKRRRCVTLIINILQDNLHFML